MTQNIEIGLLIAIIGSIIGLMTFAVGRQSAAKRDGERWGRLEGNIENIKNDIKDLKTSVSENAKNTNEEIKRLHQRIDDHIFKDHNIIRSD